MMLAKLPPVAAALAFALAALFATPALSQPRTPTHVACVGDSITAGLGSSSGTRTYPAVLQTMLGSGVQVRNFGNSGSTMLSVGDKPYKNQAEYTAATTFVSGAGASAVVAVIIMLGTNDTKSYNWTVSGGTRAAQYMTDYVAMIDHFANLSTRPVVYLALPVTVFSNTFGITNTVLVNDINPIIRQLATQKGLPLIDLATPTATRSELFPDGVHPNDTGYMLVAQIMRDGLLRGGGTGGTGGASAGSAAAPGDRAAPRAEVAWVAAALAVAAGAAAATRVVAAGARRLWRRCGQRWSRRQRNGRRRCGRLRHRGHDGDRRRHGGPGRRCCRRSRRHGDRGRRRRWLRRRGRRCRWLGRRGRDRWYRRRAAAFG